MYDQFYSLFTRKMLYVEANHQHTRQTILQLMLKSFLLVRVIFVPKHSGHRQLLVLILYNTDFSKRYNTTKKCSIFFGLDIVLGDDTK